MSIAHIPINNHVICINLTKNYVYVQSHHICILLKHYFSLLNCCGSFKWSCMQWYPNITYISSFLHFFTSSLLHFFISSCLQFFGSLVLQFFSSSHLHIVRHRSLAMTSVCSEQWHFEGKLMVWLLLWCLCICTWDQLT